MRPPHRVGPGPVVVESLQPIAVADPGRIDEALAREVEAEGVLAVVQAQRLVSRPSLFDSPGLVVHIHRGEVDERLHAAAGRIVDPRGVA